MSPYQRYETQMLMHPMLEADDSLSFSVSDPWAPTVTPPQPRAAYVPAKSSSWRGLAIAGGMFVLGAFAMVVLGVLEAPSSTSSAPVAARMKMVEAPAPVVLELPAAETSVPEHIERPIVVTPPPATSTKTVRRPRHPARMPRSAVAANSLFDTRD